MSESGKSEPGTRERLLEATIALLNERGTTGTTAREIARAAGVNLAGIGYHFGSKDALVGEALLTAIRRWIDPALAQMRRVDVDPVERLLLIVQALIAAFEAARTSIPSYLEALIAAPRSPELAPAARELFAELHGGIAGQLRDQKTLGALPPWIEPDAMATLLVSAINGLALQSTLDPARFDLHGVASQAMMLLVSARNTG